MCVYAERKPSQTQKHCEASPWTYAPALQAATSTAVTAEVQTRTVVEGMRRQVQAQIEQNRVDTQRRDELTQRSV